MKLRLRLKLVIPSLITFVIGFIGSPLFTNWYFRPVIVVDIKEFDLPKEYFEIVGREELSGIPRISLIEITNIGKSKGDNLTLEFKANNNASISGASVESRSDAISHKIEKLKDGSALLKLDAYHIRPQETILIKLLTDIPANFYLKEKLIDNGELVLKEEYERRQQYINVFLAYIFVFGFMLILAISGFIFMEVKKWLLKGRVSGSS